MSSFGRYFRGLTTYDLLGSLIPGVVVLLGILGFLPTEIPKLQIGGIGIALVSAFILGNFVQGHASKATGQRETFEQTMKAAEKPSQAESEDDSDSTTRKGEAGDTEKRCLQWIADARPRRLGPFVDPLVGWAASPRGEKLDDAVLTGVIKQHLVDTHEIPRRFDDFQVVYHLMFSRVESADGPSRAVRMQALRNFYRGLWIALWWFCVLCLISASLIVVNKCWGVPYIRFSSPNFTNVWSPVWQLLPPFLFFTMLSYFMYESQEEDFVEYLFTDYAVAIQSQKKTVVGPEEIEIDANHRLLSSARGSQKTATDDKKNGNNNEQSKTDDMKSGNNNEESETGDKKSGNNNEESETDDS